MDISNYKNLMQKTLKHLEQEFAHLQIGRASSALVEDIDIFVQQWGMKQKINQMANIVVVDAQTIKIEPWDKSTISSIEKGVFESGLGLTPINQGDYILIKIPPLTKERRQELTKLVSKMAEETKVTIRNIRHEAMNEIKKEFNEKQISEDQKKALEKSIEDLTKEFTAKIDTEAKNKADDIMKI